MQILSTILLHEIFTKSVKMINIIFEATANLSHRQMMYSFGHALRHDVRTVFVINLFIIYNMLQHKLNLLNLNELRYLCQQPTVTDMPKWLIFQPRIRRIIKFIKKEEWVGKYRCVNLQGYKCWKSITVSFVIVPTIWCNLFLLERIHLIICFNSMLNIVDS